MKAKLIICLAWASFATSHAIAQGTAFGYQGSLLVNGQPAGGNYDFTFTLFPSSQSGSPAVPILTNLDTAVSNGQFFASLNFGDVFNGSNYWLEIAVRANGTVSYATLSPRQAVTPVPYAIFSANASNAVSAVTATTAATAASVAADAIVGTLPTAVLPSGVVTNGQQGSILNGAFTGDAAGLTNVMNAGLWGLANTNLNTFLGLGSGLLVPNGLNPEYGQANVAVGYYAENQLVTGDCNTAVGEASQASVSSGDHNTSIGHNALTENMAGSYNIAVGAGALELYQGDENEAIGFLAMYTATGGPGNVAIGETSLYVVSNGIQNTAVGQSTLSELNAGSYNTAVGTYAGWGLMSGSDNIYIGNRGEPYDSGMIYLGTPGMQTNFTFAGIANGNGQGITNIQGGNIVLAGTMEDLVTTNLLAGPPGNTNWQPWVNQGYMMNLSNNLCISNLQGLLPNALNWIHLALRVTNASQSVTLSWAPYPAGPCRILPAGFTNGLVLTNSQGYFDISGKIYGTNWATNATWEIQYPGL